MKNLIAIACLLFVGMQVHAQAKIKFDSQEVDYGEVEYGGDGVRTFTFTNTGDEALEISKVQSTCGCTVPKKPDGAIAPGEKGEIQVKYDTKRSGPIRKVVTVYSNTDTPAIGLKIKGTVKKKDSKSVLEK